jgi:Na+-transporting methylmalonyl-CoA/oxaloacetate decarboxylase gamma subunit
MTNNLFLAVQITVVGMGLVFGAILLLWGVMALIVRLAADHPSDISTEKAVAEQQRRRQAAAVAVSLALAESRHMAPKAFPLPPTAIVSAWQAVLRTKMLNKRGQVR